MSTTEADPLELLGTARPDDTGLTDLVRAATGDRGAVPLTAVAEPIDYLVGTPSTAALIRMRGTARRTDGGAAEWSIFVKRLQSPRYWDQLHQIPEEFRADFLEQLPWRLEIAIHCSELGSQLNAEGHVATAEQVRYGYIGSLILRSAFTALPIELLGMPPTDELATLFEQRVRLTRFMLDLARDLD